MHITLSPLELRALDYLAAQEKVDREELAARFVRAHLSDLDPAVFAPDAPALAMLTAPVQVTPILLDPPAPTSLLTGTPGGLNVTEQAPVDPALDLEDSFMRSVSSRLPPAVQAVVPMPSPRRGPLVSVDADEAARANGGVAPDVRPPHPCLRLNFTPPRGVSKGDCQGSCEAQIGRPCHWAAGMAHQCAYFTPLRTQQRSRA